MTYTYTETKTIKASDVYLPKYTYEVPEGWVIVGFRPPLAHEMYLATRLTGVVETYGNYVETYGNYAPNEPRLILAKVYTLQEALAE